MSGFYDGVGFFVEGLGEGGWRVQGVVWLLGQ